MNRLLLFVHYNKYDQLSEHVVFLLKNLQKYYKNTIIISNSKLSDNDRKRLNGLQSKIILRSNKGYDFAAWRDGMQEVGWEELTKYDSVTIMNDTCFGPVHSFDPIFEKMERKDVDFWGLTSHPKSGFGNPADGITIQKHVQSFFICFGKNVVSSSAFKNFWMSIVELEDVDEVIVRYESQLTTVLTSSNFTYSVFFDATNIHEGPIFENLTILNVEQCLSGGMPLVKVKAFTYHKYPKYLVNKIAQTTNYPIDIIKDYFNEYFDPNQQLLMFDKVIHEVPQAGKKAELKIGVHLHAFYMDVAEEFISKFNKWPFKFDLFVTVSSASLKDEITAILKKYDMEFKEIVVLPNRGYAVIPWITVSKKYLMDYDVAGHFHTKKDAHTHEWIGKSWTEDLMSSLVEEAPNIINHFASNPKLGVVIPEIPSIFRYIGLDMYYDRRELMRITKSVYSRLNINSRRIVNFDNLLSYIFPYGMMYWYRPNALEPITELVFTEKEIPHGKLPDTTVLHAIERLFVYVAWGQGYDYRISKLKDYETEFVTGITVNHAVHDMERGISGIIGIKGAIKNRLKRELKNAYRKTPEQLRPKLLRSYNKTVKYVNKRKRSN